MGAILFVLNLLFFAICFGAVLCVIFFVPTAIYIIPYSFWCGTLNGKRLVKDAKKESFFKTIKNATILYKSWILKKEPKF